MTMCLLVSSTSLHSFMPQLDDRNPSVILRPERCASGRARWTLDPVESNHEQEVDMKLRVLACGVVLSGLCATTVQAFPPLVGQIKEAFKDDKDYQPFLETVEGLKTKCDVCHKPGADKKARSVSSFKSW